MANYVKFKQGLKKDFNTTNQPLTNGMIYFVIDENNHGSIYYDTIVDGKKATKNGTVHRVKFSGLPIKITGSVIGTGVISQDGETIEINTSTNHSHGLAHQDFTVTLSNDDTNLKWTRLGNQNGGGFWLKSIRGQTKAPAWFLPDFSAGIAFGGADTKGIISVRYSQPGVRFAGGNGDAPVWYFTITGANDKTYDLSKIGGHSSDSAKLDHNVTFKIASTADATKGGNGTATNLSGSAVDLYLPTKISGFDLLQATRFQGNADTSTVAAKLGRGGNTSLPMTFNWSGQGGQPTWLWGGENGTDMYVYNPSNFRVAHSVNTAGLDHNITFKISKVADATIGETGITTKLTENAITFTIPSDLSGFNNIQSTRFQGTADNADTVDYFHVAEEKYKYETTKTQPTSGADWCIKISTPDWNSTSETIYLIASGSNTWGTVILKTGSRQNNWWGYATNYNGTGIIGVYKLVSNSDDVYIKVNGAYTSVRIRTTFNPRISIPTTIPDYKFTSVPYQGGFFSNAIYTDNLTFTTPKYWANVPISDSSKTDTQPTFNTAYVSNWWRSTGNTGWYNETYGGGWYMTDSNFIRNYNSKAVSININSNNAWGIGGHRLATVFKGNDHVSILLSTNTLGYGLCVNNDGHWYWGKRTTNSETSTSGDSYVLYGSTNYISPYSTNAMDLGLSNRRWRSGHIYRDFNIYGNESTGDESHIRFNASDNTQRAIITFNGNVDNTFKSSTHLKIATSYGDIRLAPANGNVNIGDGNCSLTWRKADNGGVTGGLESGVYYSTPGRESVVFANMYTHTGWIFVNGIRPSNKTNWNSLGVTPAVQIHHNALYINRAVRDADTADYNLYVNGSGYINGRLDACNRSNSASYMESAIQIRERGFGGTQDDTWATAPRLSWHWAGRVQAQIGLGSNGWLYMSRDGSFGDACRLVTERTDFTWNISAHMLDGYHESSFLRYSGWWSNGSGQNINNANGMVFAYSSHGLPGSWGIVTTFDYLKDSSYRHQIYGDGWNNEMYFRTCSSDRGGWNAWQRLVYENGTWNIGITGNAATATKLQTARTIALSGAVTGSASFDGSGNITITTTSATSNTVLDNRYVKKSGDTMTGHLNFADNVGIHGLMAGGSNYWRLTGTGTDDAGVLQLTIGDNATTDYFDIIFSDYWSGTDIKAIRFGGSSINAYVPLYGAVWNDYAEFRICKDNFKPGQVVCENNDDTLNISTYRLQPGANIVSDTYGFAIGETDNAKCPIAVSGRVLAYTYEPKEEFNAGDAVCAGPNGTVSKMTRKEIKEYPERIIGTVSAVPEYETWGTGNVKVNGRIWIKVK